ncbi:MAG TPA: GNAT family N-acetyltransferase [Candidatus Dormibacteraeota bacterium]
MAAIEELTLRPVRPADYDRIVEITQDVWEGHDYIPRIFERWVADSAASFQAAELDGEVVGLQRTRPYAPGLVWYEGLRVASSHHRQGIARKMLQSAIEEARDHGFRQMRLATRDLPARRLFESAGFRPLAETRWWRGPRVEGGEPARMPDGDEAARLLPGMLASPGIELYGGIVPDMNGARDLDAGELQRLATEGRVRLGPGGRGVALLREPWGKNIAVSLLAGRGAALRELLLALRYEADADGLNHVTVNLPPEHPAEEDLKVTGYDFADADLSGYIYALDL